MADRDNLQGLRPVPPQELRLSGRFQVSQDAPLAPLGGCAAFRASDIMSPGAVYVALAPRHVSPAFGDYEALRHPSLLPILTHDRQDGALWALTNQPPGPALSVQMGVWRESHIIAGVIQPLASLLHHANGARLTLRNIRPDNVFAGAGLHQLILGPAGLALPGADQPVVFEALSSAVCAPAARGIGTVADDVFSLGVLVLTLCLGAVPLAGLPDEAILARRFEFGSADAYLQGKVIPSGLTSLLKSMLSDDPAQRPEPSDLISMETSKLFSIRGEKRARVPLVLGGQKLRTARALAWQAARRPDDFVNLLRRHVVDTWLIRELQEAGLATIAEEAAGALSPGSAANVESTVLMRVIRALDPNAPIFRGGQWFWPDALPGMLATAVENPAPVDTAQGIIPLASQLLGPENDYTLWTGRLGTQLRAMVQLARRSGRKGGARFHRLMYDSNPWQYCLSPICKERRLLDMPYVLGALDTQLLDDSSASERIGRQGLLDSQMRAFLESQCIRRGVTPPLSASASGLAPWLADLLLVALVQRRFGERMFKGISRALLPMLVDELRMWRGRTQRQTREARLQTLSETGDLQAMLDVIDAAPALLLDHEQAARARLELEAIEAQLADHHDNVPQLDAECRQTSQFVAMLSGIGLSLLACGYEIWR